MRKLFVIYILFITLASFGQAVETVSLNELPKKDTLQATDRMFIEDDSSYSYYAELGDILEWVDNSVSASIPMISTATNYTSTSGSLSIAFIDLSIHNDTLAIGSATTRSGNQIYVARTDYTNSVIITASPVIYYKSVGYTSLSLSKTMTGCILQSDGTSWYVMGIFYDPYYRRTFAVFPDTVGVGAYTAKESLNVSGAINIGSTSASNAGSIRYNSGTFQGYNGSAWLDMNSKWSQTGNDISNVNTGKVTLYGTVYADTLPTATKVYWLQHWNNSTGRFEKVSPLSFYRDLQDDLRDLSAAGTPDMNATWLRDNTKAAIYQAKLTDKVGIGTNSPTEQLHLTGNIRVPTTTATTGIIYKDAKRWLHNFIASGTDGHNVFLGEMAGNTDLTGSTSGFDGSRNVAIGDSAMYAVTRGRSNTAVGFRSLRSITTGINNSAYGNEALLYTTTGTYNAAFGMDALRFNTTGDHNAGFGADALYTNVFGSYNTAVGDASMWLNTSGNYNTAVGTQALLSNTSGSYNSVMGYGALYYKVAGNYNSVFGTQAMGASTEGHRNSVFGYLAMNNGTGHNNVIYGNKAATNLTTGSFNLIIGDSAMASTATGNFQLNIGNIITGSMTPGGKYIETDIYQIPSTTSTAGQIKQNGVRLLHTYSDGGGANLFFGENSGNFTMTGNYNYGIGESSCSANTTGIFNYALGRESLLYNQSGSYNVAVGSLALSGVSGYSYDYQVAIGTYASRYNVGSSNVSIGQEALQGGASDGSANGSNNVAIGRATLLSNLSGSENIAIGYATMTNNAAGSENTAVGRTSLYNNISGTGNVGFGYKSLFNNTSGTYNVAIGYNALFSNSTGSGNVAIGYNAGYNETGSNKLYIDNSNTATPLIGGDFDANTVTINGTVSATGGTYSTFYKFTPSADPPSSAAEGMIYYDSDDKKIKVYNGTTWVDLF